MIDQELLDILVCPETKAELALADDALIADLNKKQEAGELLNRAGQKITEKFEAGLKRKDGAYLYRIQNNIPIMLIDEGIPLS